MNKVQEFQLGASRGADVRRRWSQYHRWKYGTRRGRSARSPRRANAANNPYALFQGNSRSWVAPGVRSAHAPCCCPPTCAAPPQPMYLQRRVLKVRDIDKPVAVAGQAMTDFDSRHRKDDQDGRLRHGQDRRRRSTTRPVPRPGHRRDRLLHRERASRTGARPVQEGRGGEVHLEDQNTWREVRHEPVGGLLSKGHPLGATGLAQCTELVWQLRGTADKRQVEGREGRAAAQPRPRRRVRDDDVYRAD